MQPFNYSVMTLLGAFTQLMGPPRGGPSPPQVVLLMLAADAMQYSGFCFLLKQIKKINRHYEIVCTARQCLFLLSYCEAALL